MSNEQSRNSKASADSDGLPYEAGSTSELLNSTNIFTVEILSLVATPFVAGNDELEHRVLSMELKLVKNFKGKLDTDEDQTFTLEVQQHRESDLFVTDFHGIWSHIEPEVGVRYIVISRGTLTSPAAAMQEGPLLGLLDDGFESDIRLSLEAERQYRDILDEPKDDATLVAASKLLDLTYENRAASKDVFGRYLWARVQPIFLVAPDRILPQVLRTIMASDAAIELRRVLVADLYAAVLLLDANLNVNRPVVRSFFALLRQPSAKQLQNTLVEVQLYNLIFKEGQPRFPVGAIFSDQAEGNEFRASVAEVDTDRGRKLLSWLTNA